MTMSYYKTYFKYVKELSSNKTTMAFIEHQLLNCKSISRVRIERFCSYKSNIALSLPGDDC